MKTCTSYVNYDIKVDSSCSEHDHMFEDEEKPSTMAKLYALAFKNN